MIPAAESTPIVVQHNALVNARFAFSALEMRLFLAMLARIGRHDTALPICRIPVRELAPDSQRNSLYAEVAEMTKKFAGRVLHLEVLGPSGGRLKEPNRLNRPLMGRCDYLHDEGVVEAVFNEHLRPYLLELTNNFTKAQLGQLLLIRSPTSHRIYWLLREYAAFGKRTVSVAELRDVLGLTTEYAGRFDNFRERVLDRAQQELAGTDLPFTYELVKEGRVVTEIRFLFASAAKPLPAPDPAAPASWQALLLGAGVAAKSLAGVEAQLAAGDYDEGYVRYVVATVRAQVAAGKVKKEAGAVYKALTAGYLLAEYRKAAAPAAAKGPKATAAERRRREKLLHEIEDKRGTLRFVAHEAREELYPGPARAEAVARIEQEIAALAQQLGG